MSHRVHPKAYRIKKINDWDTRGFYRDPARWLEEDFIIREFLKEKIGKAGIEKIEIERFPGKLNIIVSTARPGLIIGRGGEGVEYLKKALSNRLLKEDKFSDDNKSTLKENKKKFKTKKNRVKSSVRTGLEKRKKEVRIEIREIKNPWTSASLVGQWIAQQIERRVPYRRVLKQGISKVVACKEIKGVKIRVSGRLNGAEIARSEWLRSGRLPLQTIRAEIDFARCEAHCSYGIIGIKVWLYKGERFE